MGQNIVRAIGVFLLLWAIPATAYAAEPGWEASTELSYSSANFGAPTTSTSSGLATGIARDFRSGRVSLTVPYEKANTTGGVRTIGGVPRQTGDIGAFRPRGRASTSGIGDMVLRGQYRVREEEEQFPSVFAGAHIKFPTGDENEGLGTGEFDHGVELGISKHLSEKGVGYLNFGFTWIGMPPGVFLDDQWNVGVGYGHTFTEFLGASVFFEQANALIPGRPDARDVVFGLSFDVTPEMRIRPGVRLGLSEGSADYVLSTAVITRF